MDLKEMPCSKMRRHPWELERAHALQQILDAHAPGGHRSILDIGCGDGYTVARLLEASDARGAVAYDINFSAQQLESLTKQYPSVRFVNRLNGQTADLMLMLDIVEHVDDDEGFVIEHSRRLDAGGHLLVTVPAFGWLFSEHDRFLEHRRRYSLAQLTDLLRRSGLNVLASGYLFGVPLVLRAGTVLAERLFNQRTRPRSLGEWSHGAVFSAMVETALRVDNAAHLLLSSRNLLAILKVRECTALILVLGSVAVIHLLWRQGSVS